MGSAIAEQAEGLLASEFETLGSVTKYIRAFRTRRGRELALERDRNGIYLWTEQVADRPLDLPAPEAYPPGRSRNSNLNGKAQRIATGKAAFYWRLDSPGHLSQLCAWYQSM